MTLRSIRVLLTTAAALAVSLPLIRPALDAPVGAQVTTPGVVVAEAFVAMPFLVISVEGALRSADPRYEEAAATLGASPFQFWHYVGLPVLWPNLLGCLSLLFANAFGAIATAYALTGSSLNIVPILLYAQIRGDVLNNPHLGYALAFGMIFVTGLANVFYIWFRTRSERWLK